MIKYLNMFNFRDCNLDRKKVYIKNILQTYIYFSYIFIALLFIKS